MLNEEQFKEFMGALENRRNENLKEVLAIVVPVQRDREMLIRMDETQKNMMLIMQNNRSEDLLKVGRVESVAGKAHERVDVLERTIGRILAAGGFMNLALVISVVILLIKKG